MAATEGRDPAFPQAFGGCDDRGVDGSEREVPVAPHEFRDAQPVPGGDRLRDEVAGGEVAEESDLRFDTQARPEQIDDLGDDKFRDDERPGLGLEQAEAGGVMGVVGVDVGVERSGVDDQRDAATSLAKISSMRSEMSV